MVRSVHPRAPRKTLVSSSAAVPNGWHHMRQLSRACTQPCPLLLGQQFTLALPTPHKHILPWRPLVSSLSSKSHSTAEASTTWILTSELRVVRGRRALTVLLELWHPFRAMGIHCLMLQNYAEILKKFLPEHSFVPSWLAVSTYNF